MRVTGKGKQAVSNTIKVMVEKGPSGRRLTKPVEFMLNLESDSVSKDIQRYVVESLSFWTPTLIPLVFRNRSLLKLMEYLKYERSGSHNSPFSYVHAISRFCEYAGMEPDQLIAECKTTDGELNPKGLAIAAERLEQYFKELKARGYAPKSVATWIAFIKSFYSVNNVPMVFTKRMSNRVVARDRAPTPEELQRLIDIADLREKVVISMLALGGFRIGTLAALRYRHVKEDLEKGVIPVHVHVEAEITKGKYHDYDTFLGREAVEYLKAYLELRRKGSPDGKIPPEEITDESPLIRSKNDRAVKPVEARQLYRCIHNLYYRAGLLGDKRFNRFVLRAHSIRKFFRTQLAALGVDRDYIEYMMGHTITTYHDIQMKGVEFLRNVYAASGLSIRPKTQLSRIEALKEIIRAWGMNPEEVLTREALAVGHRVEAGLREEDQVKALGRALKEMLRKELLDAKGRADL